MTVWALVCPSSRGIGLNLARRLLRTTNIPLVATARKDVDQTREEILSGNKDGNGNDIDESRLEVLKIDVCGVLYPNILHDHIVHLDSISMTHNLAGLTVKPTDESTIEDAAKHCRSRFPSSKDSPSHLHAAFVVPGILYPEKAPGQLDADHILETFRVNTIGPMLILKHFSSFLPRKTTAMPSSSELGGSLPSNHATWLTMSARVGSISDNSLGGWYSYRASKAAVNQVTKTFDAYLKISAGDKAMAMSYHPGTVKTGLSKDFWSNVKEEKLFSAEYATEKLLEVVRSFDGRIADVRGKCWDWKGDEIKP